MGIINKRKCENCFPYLIQCVLFVGDKAGDEPAAPADGEKVAEEDKPAAAAAASD